MRRLLSCRGQDKAQRGHSRPEKVEVGGSCSTGTWTSELAIPRRLCEGATATLLIWSASLFAV